MLKNKIDLERTLASLIDGFFMLILSAILMVISGNLFNDSELPLSIYLYLLINIILLYLYHSVIPYFYSGKTIGKAIMKIKILRKDDKKAKLSNLIKRNIRANLLVVLLIGLLILFIFYAICVIPSNIELIVYSSDLLIIYYFVMVIVKLFIFIKIIVNKETINDKLAKTKVVIDGYDPKIINYEIEEKIKSWADIEKDDVILDKKKENEPKDKVDDPLEKGYWE